MVELGINTVLTEMCNLSICPLLCPANSWLLLLWLARFQYLVVLVGMSTLRFLVNGLKIRDRTQHNGLQRVFDNLFLHLTPAL